MYSIKVSFTPLSLCGWISHWCLFLKIQENCNRMVSHQLPHHQTALYGFVCITVGKECWESTAMLQKVIHIKRCSMNYWELFLCIVKPFHCFQQSNPSVNYCSMRGSQVCMRSGDSWLQGRVNRIILNLFLLRVHNPESIISPSSQNTQRMWISNSSFWSPTTSLLQKCLM